MEDEDFWGHSVKRGEGAAHGGLSHAQELSKDGGQVTDISTEEMKKRIGRLETAMEEPKSVSRLGRAAIRTGATAGSPIRKHSFGDSELHHTRSPSYTSEEESEDERHGRKSSDRSEEERSDRDRREYSDQFESSEPESRVSESEDEKTHTRQEDHRVTMADQLRKQGNTAGPTKATKPKGRQTPFAKKSLTSPRAGNKSKRRQINKTTTKTVSQTRTRPFNLSVMKPESFVPTRSSDPSRHLRSASFRDEIEYFKKQLAEAKNENRTLRELQRRHELALTRLDTNRAAMPTLLERQAEELRIAKEQLRMQKEKQRELERVLRERDDRLIHALDKMKRLDKAMKDKGIDYRAQGGAAEAASTLKQQVEEKEKKIRDLERQVTLLVKNHKHQLSIEVTRHKETQRKLKELEEEYKNHQLGKTKGYHTTRTARRSISEKGADQARLTQSFSAGLGNIPEKVRPMLSELADHQDSIEEDVLAGTHAVLASLKLSPAKAVVDAHSESKKNSNDKQQLSNARQNRNVKKTAVVEEVMTKRGGEHELKIAGRRQSSQKMVPDERPQEKTDSVENMINSDAVDDMITGSKRDGRANTYSKRKQPSVGDDVDTEPTSHVKSSPTRKPSDKPLQKGVSLFDESPERKTPPKPSVLDEILQSTKPVPKTPAQETPKSIPKSNDEFLDDLFGPRTTSASAAGQKKTDSLDQGSKSSGADSGIDHSVDSTPKQVQSANGTRPPMVKSDTLDLDGDLFSPRKPAGPKTASNGLFPWETAAVTKATAPQQTKQPKSTGDLFPSEKNLGTVT